MISFRQSDFMEHLKKQEGPPYFHFTLMAEPKGSDADSITMLATREFDKVDTEIKDELINRFQSMGIKYAGKDYKGSFIFTSPKLADIDGDGLKHALSRRGEIIERHLQMRFRDKYTIHTSQEGKLYRIELRRKN